MLVCRNFRTAPYPGPVIIVVANRRFCVPSDSSPGSFAHAVSGSAILWTVLCFRAWSLRAMAYPLPCKWVCVIGVGGFCLSAQPRSSAAHNHGPPASFRAPTMATRCAPFASCVQNRPLLRRWRRGRRGSRFRLILWCYALQHVFQRIHRRDRIGLTLDRHFTQWRQTVYDLLNVPSIRDG